MRTTDPLGAGCRVNEKISPRLFVGSSNLQATAHDEDWQTRLAWMRCRSVAKIGRARKIIGQASFAVHRDEGTKIPGLQTRSAFASSARRLSRRPCDFPDQSRPGLPTRLELAPRSLSITKHFGLFFVEWGPRRVHEREEEKASVPALRRDSQAHTDGEKYGWSAKPGCDLRHAQNVRRPPADRRNCHHNHINRGHDIIYGRLARSRCDDQVVSRCTDALERTGSSNGNRRHRGPPASGQIVAAGRANRLLLCRRLIEFENGAAPSTGSGLDQTIPMRRRLAWRSTSPAAKSSNA